MKEYLELEKLENNTQLFGLWDVFSIDVCAGENREDLDFVAFGHCCLDLS